VAPNLQHMAEEPSRARGQQCPQVVLWLMAPHLQHTAEEPSLEALHLQHVAEEPSREAPHLQHMAEEPSREQPQGMLQAALWLVAQTERRLAASSHPVEEEPWLEQRQLPPRCRQEEPSTGTALRGPWQRQEVRHLRVVLLVVLTTLPWLVVDDRLTRGKCLERFPSEVPLIPRQIALAVVEGPPRAVSLAQEVEATKYLMGGAVPQQAVAPFLQKELPRPRALRRPWC